MQRGEKRRLKKELEGIRGRMVDKYLEKMDFNDRELYNLSITLDKVIVQYMKNYA